MSPEVQTLLEQLREKSRADIQRTPSPDCPACQARRLHRLEEWQHHPKTGTGFHCARETNRAGRTNQREAQSQQQ